jgi:hypothetical protein
VRAGTRIVVVVVGAIVLVGFGFGVFYLTKELFSGEAQGTAEAGAGQSATTPISTAEESPSIECGEIATTSAHGYPLGELEPLVRGIHDAACRGDYAGLLPFMETTFNSTPREEAVAEWEREDSDRRILQTLAETLEVPPVGDQGGQYFCHPDGAVAVFPRGTITHPGMWSMFDLVGQDRPAACDGAR